MNSRFVVILHGWGAEASRWQGVKDILEEQGRSVFIPDLPCFGREPCPDAVWGLDEYAAWVVDQCARRGFPRFALIGHSFGGAVAVKAAARFSERVEKLVLVNSAGIRIPRGSFKLKLWLSIVHLGQRIFTLPVLRSHQQLVRRILYKLLGSIDYFRAEGIKKEILKKILSEDIRGDLRHIRAATLIIWAKKDRQTPLKWAKIFNEGIPNSQLKLVRGANHVFPYYEPQRFIDLTKDFLAQSPS